MLEIIEGLEMTEVNKPEVTDYKEIKPESKMLIEEVKEFWDNIFSKIGFDKMEWEYDFSEAQVSETDIEKTLNSYFDDLKCKSECSNTIPDKPFDSSDLEKITPEENSIMREEFDEKKTQLKKEWEGINGCEWPKYDHDVYSSNGKLIRKEGSDYDAHHIQPLGMGGKNEVSNITPLNAEVHYDKQGVHAPDSPYSKLDQMLGGMD